MECHIPLASDKSVLNKNKCSIISILSLAIVIHWPHNVPLSSEMYCKYEQIFIANWVTKQFQTQFKAEKKYTLWCYDGVLIPHSMHHSV